MPKEPRIVCEPPYHFGLILFTFLSFGLLLWAAYRLFFIDLILSVGAACLGLFSLIAACTMLFLNSQRPP